MTRRFVPLLLLLGFLMLVANAFDTVYEFESAVPPELSELWSFRQEANGSNALHVNNSRGEIIVEINLCLETLKSHTKQKNRKNKKARKEKGAAKQIETSNDMNTGSVSETGNKIVTVQNNEMENNKKKKKNKKTHKQKKNKQNKRTGKKKGAHKNKKTIYVTIENIRYSNDGPSDHLQLSIGKSHFDNFTTVGEFKGGQGWNEFLDSGKLGNVAQLKPGNHTLSIAISTDQYGVELDFIHMRFENQDPGMDVLCGSSVRFVPIQDTNV